MDNQKWDRLSFLHSEGKVGRNEKSIFNPIFSHLRSFLCVCVLFILTFVHVNAQITDTQIFKQKPDQKVSDPKALPKAVKDSLNKASTPAKEGNSLQLNFVKAQEEIPPGVMFFNVLKISNQTEEKQSLNILFNIPSFAKLILQDKDKDLIELEVGEKRFIPIRVSFPAETEGGVSYKLTANIETSEGKLLESIVSEVAFTKQSKWRVSTPFAKKYISEEDEDYIEISFRFKNSGNCREELSLDFEVGKLLRVEEEDRQKFKRNLSLRPSLDTTIYMNVKAKTAKSAFPDPKDKSLKLKVSSPNDTLPQELSVYLEGIARDFRNLLDLSNSPLVIAYSQDDLEASSSQLTVGGKILMKDHKELSYQMSFSDLKAIGDTTKDKSEYVRRNIKGNIQYTNPRFFLRGGNVGGGAGVNVSGTGIQWGHHFGSLEPGEGVETRFISAYNAAANEFGTSALAKTNLSEKLSVEGGIGFKENFKERSFLLGVQGGGQYSFLESHSIGLNLGTTYKIGPAVMEGPRGTGMAYSLDYTGNIREKWTLGFENEFISRNYASVSGGVFNLRGELGYQFNDDTKLGASYNSRSNLILADGKEGKREAHGKTQAESLKFAFNTRIGKVAWGSSFDHSLSQKQNFNSGSQVKIGTMGIRTGFGTSFKTNHADPIIFNPSLIIGAQKRTVLLPGGDRMGDSNIHGSAGIKGSYKDFSLDARYSIGPEGNVNINEGTLPANRQKVDVSASYQASMHDERLRLQTNADVKYDIGEKVLESLLSSSFDYEMLNGWSMGVNAKFNLGQFLSRKEENPFTVGLRAAKAFDMVQPRLKFYNLLIEFYKDENGNLVRDEGEEGVGSVLVKMERAKDPENLVINGERILFNPPETMSDETGEVKYNKIPQGHYLIELKELIRLTDFANLSGVDFEVFLQKSSSVSVPFSRSVTFEGKTIIERDKFSRLFGISPAKIRITIIDANGKKYHTLTAGNGNYVITVPYSESYTVSMKNVLGSKFEVKGARACN